MRISAMDSTAARASTSSSSRFRAGRWVCGLSFIFLFFLGVSNQDASLGFERGKVHPARGL